MAESTQLKKIDPENSIEAALEVSQDQSAPIRQPIIIWTPRFIGIFALVLAGGLTLASLLTQGWQNHYYQPEWVLLAETAIMLGLWITVSIRASTPWVRIGGIFGAIWAIFTAINFVATLLLSVNPALPIIAYLNAATNCALFACYICLSIHHVPVRRWDSWFFRVAPLLGVCIILASILLTPAEMRSWQNVGSITATVTLYLSISIWWLRPSCWQAQPGPTFFFGLAPIILLVLSIPRMFDGPQNFFLLQVSLLCFVLGIMRLLQGELQRNDKRASAGSNLSNE